jgi:hypothetical protein
LTSSLSSCSPLSSPASNLMLPPAIRSGLLYYYLLISFSSSSFFLCLFCVMA